MYTIWQTKILYLIKMQSFLIGFALLALFQSTPSMADDQNLPQTSPKTQSSISDRQQEELNQLRQRIQLLEDKESAEETHPQFGLNLGAYGDINYFTKNREANHASFSLGSLDLYSTAQVGSRLTFLVEMQLELDEATSEGNFDLERFWVGYTFNDLLTVRAGRTHTALGYWNITYHHGKQLFLTVDRPFFLAFEDDGGVLPVHTIGIELMGSQSLPTLRWMYELDIGNGHHIDTATKLLVPDDIADSNNSKQVALRLSIEPTRLPGLTLGIFGTSDSVAVDSNGNIDERIFGGDFSYLHDKVEFITEYYRMQNPGHHADAYYIQLGYKIARDITPYARYESLNDVDPTDPYFSRLENNTSRYQRIAGVRYDIDELRSALKFQYRIDRKLGSETFHVWEAQWSFSF